MRNLDAIASYLRPVAEHLVNGLILSAVIFLGSLLAFRLLFRGERGALLHVTEPRFFFS